jgi:hypothetical protein
LASAAVTYSHLLPTSKRGCQLNRRDKLTGIMKFGRNLPRNQVPEWAASYINYKGLKKLIKAASLKVREGEPVDPAGGPTSILVGP